MIFDLLTELLIFLSFVAQNLTLNTKINTLKSNVILMIDSYASSNPSTTLRLQNFVTSIRLNSPFNLSLPNEVRLYSFDTKNWIGKPFNERIFRQSHLKPAASRFIPTSSNSFYKDLIRVAKSFPTGNRVKTSGPFVFFIITTFPVDLTLVKNELDDVKNQNGKHVFVGTFTDLNTLSSPGFIDNVFGESVDPAIVLSTISALSKTTVTVCVERTTLDCFTYNNYQCGSHTLTFHQSVQPYSCPKINDPPKIDSYNPGICGAPHNCGCNFKCCFAWEAWASLPCINGNKSQTTPIPIHIDANLPVCNDTKKAFILMNPPKTQPCDSKKKRLLPYRPVHSSQINDLEDDLVKMKDASHTDIGVRFHQSNVDNPFVLKYMKDHTMGTHLLQIINVLLFIVGIILFVLFRKYRCQCHCAQSQLGVVGNTGSVEAVDEDMLIMEPEVDIASISKTMSVPTQKSKSQLTEIAQKTELTEAKLFPSNITPLSSESLENESPKLEQTTGIPTTESVQKGTKIKSMESGKNKTEIVDKNGKTLTKVKESAYQKVVAPPKVKIKSLPVKKIAINSKNDPYVTGPSKPTVPTTTTKTTTKTSNLSPTYETESFKTTDTLEKG